MKTITSRFVMLVATAAVAPLVLYGFISFRSLLAGTRESVMQGNLNVARRAADQVLRYISTSTEILKALSADLRHTELELWQQERILRNYVLAFPEFREITLFDAEGNPVVSSHLTTPTEPLLPSDRRFDNETYLSPVTVDDDLMPTTTVTARVTQIEGRDEWLVGVFDLMEIWRMVDGIRVGNQGYALILALDGRLIAHGSPDQKRRIARGENLIDYPLLRGADVTSPVVSEFTNDDDVQMLAAAVPIADLGWTLIVEQPTSDAYRVAWQLVRQLTIAIVLALGATVTLGFLWSRSFIRPIGALMQGTRAIAAGRLDTRVTIASHDEFRELGDSFNRMADRVIELQDDVRKQERQAIFGRIAAGLVHDLSHPVQNIANSSKLILKMADDAEYRATFKRTVEREFGAIRRVLESLKNLARPIPLERFPVDLNRSVAEVAESMEPEAQIAGVTLEIRLAPDLPRVEGDLFALSRVYRNLITNALQATPPGGRLTIATSRTDHGVQVSFADTGCGIPADRLKAIFEDFATTKRAGLGLGLAVCKKIVEQLGGTIEVTSSVGQGSTFSLTLQALPDADTESDTPVGTTAPESAVHEETTRH